MTVPKRTPLRWLLALVLIVASCAAPEGDDDAGPQQPPTSTTGAYSEPLVLDLDACDHELTIGTSNFECLGLGVLLGIPEACLSSSCGLIMDLHPGGWDGARHDEATNMQSRGNAAGYVVLQPSSPGGIWAFADASYRLRAIVDELIDAINIDITRVHVGGASLGGFLTWVMVCDHADLIASAVPLAAGTGGFGESCEFDNRRSPSEEVDMLVIHGREDSIVPFESGVAQLQRAVDAWGMEFDEVLADADDYRWTRWTNDSGTVLEFVEHSWIQPGSEGEGHCIPGADVPGGCGADTEVSYTDAALAFYLAHPKRP